ncbi:hypothetical protein [Ferroplasma sp.]|jgi:hypothetical protein|uniref:hypothetical protein n=1 Tax=Ferroplasma sp. TaxID=2591003 RepID=UPI002620079B|nr:hypothetical protein [Ferroplasma sp.]
MILRIRGKKYYINLFSLKFLKIIPGNPYEYKCKEHNILGSRKKILLHIEDAHRDSLQVV